MEQLKAFGENVRKIRTSKDMKQSDLAERIGRSVKWLGQVENGIVDSQIGDAFKIAEVLEVKLTDLLSTPVQLTFNNYNQKGTYIANNQTDTTKVFEIYESLVNSLQKRIAEMENANAK